MSIDWDALDEAPPFKAAHIALLLAQIEAELDRALGALGVREMPAGMKQALLRAYAEDTVSGNAPANSRDWVRAKLAEPDWTPDLKLEERMASYYGDVPAEFVGRPVYHHFTDAYCIGGDGLHYHLPANCGHDGEHVYCQPPVDAYAESWGRLMYGVTLAKHVRAMLAEEAQAARWLTPDERALVDEIAALGVRVRFDALARLCEGMKTGRKSGEQMRDWLSRSVLEAKMFGAQLGARADQTTECYQRLEAAYKRTRCEFYGAVQS